MENFKTKYNYLPGDAPAFGGDGDGIITIKTQLQAVIFDCEIANFWIDIDPTIYTGSTICDGNGIAPVISGSGKNVPLSKLGKNNSYFMTSAISWVGFNPGHDIDPSIQKNFYTILGPENDVRFFNDTDSTNSSVKPANLLALDTKIDDGVADTGNVISGSINLHNPTYIPSYTGNFCSSGHTYYVDHNIYECTPMIRIGASAGGPQ